MVPENISVQRVARQTLADIGATISDGSTERSIAEAAIELLSKYGVTETWYYDCAALVLSGTRSCLSISGREYSPSNELVGQTNLVTIDLSPLSDGLWGDCARSFVVENGRVVANPSLPEFQSGIEAIETLHAEVRQFVQPGTGFCDLFRFANDLTIAMGFESLDFARNVGHSIASCLEDREFICEDSNATLGSVPCFTFEPHIRKRGGKWGFKHEEIYYFDTTGRAQVL